MAATMDGTRINKYLAELGLCSRREADKLLADGRVKVNGAVAELGMKVLPTDLITLDDKTVSGKKPERVYLAYHKPVGIICTSDPKAKDNIIEAVGYPERIFHIGRLDVASSGLILLTNDGSIVNKILRAEGLHEKEYIVSVHKKITPDFLQVMHKGVQLEDGKTKPADIAQVDEKTFSIILVEGRNRQIRRMCEALGYEVTGLQRVRIMDIQLGKLRAGEWRHLTKEEEQGLLTALK